jgi:hypothetical protein
MFIRSYQPRDEHAQVRIYNVAASALPGFKPATAEEVARRYPASHRYPEARYYATFDDEVVGYAVFNDNGRISYPWCLPDARDVREPLLETVLDALRQRGVFEAWAAYRADWPSILNFFTECSFNEKRIQINYVRELGQLPWNSGLPPDRTIAPLKQEDLPQLVALAPALFCDSDLPTLASFYWNNPFHDFRDSLFGLRKVRTGELLAVYALVAHQGFADPTKIDAAMPCFRLGAFGTECQRHKRVNGLFSCVFAEEAEAELLLSVAAHSLATRSELTHLASQAPSDAPGICALYDRFFRRQGSFPILARRLVT